MVGQTIAVVRVNNSYIFSMRDTRSWWEPMVVTRSTGTVKNLLKFYELK